MRKILLKNNFVEMVWRPPNQKKYINRGYIFTAMNEKFMAKVQDVVELSSGAKIPVQCDYCGEIYYPTSRNYEKNHKKGQMDCCVSCKGEKIKNTVQEKYGVDNVVLLEEVSNKMKNTCIEKYGVPHPLQNKEIYQKTQDSFNQHYGVKNGVADLRNVKELSDKIASTNRERYGGDSPFCSKEIRAYIRQSLFENGTCPTSKKQIKLQEMINSIYGNCKLNYPCDRVSLDCASIINNIKIDIEYDGWYWHKNTQNQDNRRDGFVKSQGYKILRFHAYKDRLPTKEELTRAINTLITTNKHFLRVELK